MDDDENDVEAVNVPEPVTLPSVTRLSITVNKLHVAAEWKWDMIEGEETCGICRMEFEAACNKCKFPGDLCPLTKGQCGHAFHMHCIMKWIEAPTNQASPQCPLCRREWRYEN